MCLYHKVTIKDPRFQSTWSRKFSRIRFIHLKFENFTLEWIPNFLLNHPYDTRKKRRFLHEHFLSHWQQTFLIASACASGRTCDFSYFFTPRRALMFWCEWVYLEQHKSKSDVQVKLWWLMMENVMKRRSMEMEIYKFSPTQWIWQKKLGWKNREIVDSLDVQTESEL